MSDTYVVDPFDGGPAAFQYFSNQAAHISGVAGEQSSPPELDVSETRWALLICKPPNGSTQYTVEAEAIVSTGNITFGVSETFSQKKGNFATMIDTQICHKIRADVDTSNVEVELIPVNYDDYVEHLIANNITATSDLSAPVLYSTDSISGEVSAQSDMTGSLTIT